MTPARILPATLWIAALVGMLSTQASAQDATKKGAAPKGDRPGFGSLEDLDGYYANQLHELNRRRLADLTELASRLNGLEAERAYSEIFKTAISNDLYREAEPAARNFLASGLGHQRDQTLAYFIGLVAKAERGEYEQSIKDLETYIREHPAPADPNQRADANTVLAIGEAYLQRLFAAGRYDIARRLCTLAVENGRNPVTRAHFQNRLARVEMVGKPAPPIQGTDIDGKPLSLADLKGKVVLIDFWATWCPPCVAALPHLKELQSKHGDQGFVILGVNGDAMREGVQGVKDVLPGVRRFLLDKRISWANLADSTGALAKAYGVTEIPANFLVGREGTIVGVELSGAGLERAVAKAVGAAKP